MSRNKRIKTIGEDFVNAVAAKALPSEQQSLKQIEDEALFRVDNEGASDPIGQASSGKQEKKKSSRAKSLHTSTLKRINELAEKTLEQQKKQPVVPAEEELRPDYVKPELRDFWSLGEGGLPPVKPLAKRDLRGVDASKVLNEWNIHTAPLTSVAKTRKIHDRNKKRQVDPLVPLSSLSYNPAAEDHVKGLVTLAKTQGARETEAKKRKSYRERIKALHEKVKMQEALREEKGEDCSDEESEADEEQMEIYFPQTSERKTKTQRHKEKKARHLAVLNSLRAKERRLLSDIENVRKINKELDKQKANSTEIVEASKATTAIKTVKINGRKLAREKLLGPNPLPAVLPPSQLPENMRKIPGVGGLFEEEYVKLRMKNVVESGRPASRGRKEAQWKKARKVEKFDLDQIAQGVAKPRFKVPEKLKKPVEPAPVKTKKGK